MIPQVINKQPIAGTPHLSLIVLSYLDKQGKQQTWVSAERPGNKRAVVIVALKNDMPNNPLLVVIREFRVPIQGYEWGLPAGLIDEGQSIEETAVRELKEETGLDVVKFLRPPTPFVYNSPGMTNESISFAFVEVAGQTSNKHLEGSEDITTHLYSRDSVRALIEDAVNPQSGIMIGAKAWLVFERFVKYGDI